jgi:hypothetical protein
VWQRVCVDVRFLSVKCKIRIVDIVKETVKTVKFEILVKKLPIMVILLNLFYLIFLILFLFPMSRSEKYRKLWNPTKLM